MRELTVRASKKYKIFVSEKAEGFSRCVLPLIKGDNVAVVADSEAFRLHGETIKALLADKTTFFHIVKNGEESKNLMNYGALLNALADDGLTRNDCVVTFGGGMVGDLGAFVASTYMRGIGLFAVPTTLLSMVDSSVGGKTAVNLSRGKNLCGTFYQPDAVYINLGFLKTLPVTETESGMGEVIKYSYLPRGENICVKNRITEKLVSDCLKIKAEIVSEDERESGRRKLLNFGHTVGHAIERLSEFTVPHGICVAKGIRYALALSRAYYGYGEEITAKLEKRLDFFSDLSCEFSPEELYRAILSDKKSDGVGVTFVLINGELNAETVKIPVSDLKEFLKKGEALL